MRRHAPVMLTETLEAMPDRCDFVLDGTLWHAWHTAAMASRWIQVVWVDRDTHMIDKAKIFLESDGLLDRVQIVQWSYASLSHLSQESGRRDFDYMFLDIWVNMDHFKEADRGFSIKLDGELDMRFDTSTGMSVRERLTKTHFEELDTLFAKYTDFGQKYREWIVRSLLDARKHKQFVTTYDLRERAQSAWLGDKKLAVIFQAFRIHVNNELGELELFLERFMEYLRPGGRCAIMTYHSWEDKIVKYSFKELVANGRWKLYNKKVIKPHRQEVDKNKAARSAKFRIIEKT